MSLSSKLGVALALLCSASMWFYVQRVLIPHQREDAAARAVPRGNLSDLYPRWVGARELLLHHRNPYGRDITEEIQEGYYGRRLDPARPADPRDQQGFAYPVYVVFVLAPVVGVPFPLLQTVFYWLLAALTAVSVLLWLRALSWHLPVTIVVAFILLVLGSFATAQGIKLQQLSLLVAALLAGSAACVARGKLFAGGALLALATVKPQLAWPLGAWLLLWTVSDWPARRQLAFGFTVVMGALLAGSEILLPGWWRMFAEAIRQYREYTHNQSILEQLSPWKIAATVLTAAAILTWAALLWKLRRAPSDSSPFGRAVALTMALTVLIVPMFAPYNQVLLLPAILLLVRKSRMLLSGSRGVRVLALTGAVTLAWQWIACVTLSSGYFLASPAWAMQRWKLPLLATFYLPAIVFALALIVVHGRGRPFVRAQAAQAN